MGLKLRNILIQFSVQGKYFPLHAMQVMVKWRTRSKHTHKFDTRWRCVAQCMPRAINTL